MNQNTLENYFTVKQFAVKFPFVSQSSLRWMIFNADKNGFSKVIKRIGAKILINATAFEELLKEINQETAIKIEKRG